MRLIKLQLSIVFLFVIWIAGLQAQTMNVHQTNGSQTSYELIDIQKLTFASGELIVTKTDDNSEVFGLDDLMVIDNFNF
jgi:hypothetical protein